MTATSGGDRQRDAASLRVLGAFFLVLGSTVLIATYWELDRPHAAIVNVVSALTLFGVGLGMAILSRRWSKSD